MTTKQLLKPLPIGIATFRDIIEGGYLYVDKTRYIHELVGHYKGVYFMSRPRRFGKSLMVSTLEEIFRGSRDLFQGLWIHEETDYNWAVHPVIRLDLNKEQIRNAADLRDALSAYLVEAAQRYDIALESGPPDRQFRWLIQELAKQNRVAILIDEYDKPILDNMHDLEEANHIRQVLKGFYGVIKAMDAYVRFVFVTGISKFSKVSVFSDLNNLDDLTLQTSMAASLGLTEEEVRDNFQAHIADFAQATGEAEEALLERLRQWYDGFRFAPHAPNVYNPFSTLLLFKTRRFSNYWFETGTPSFLVNMIHKGNYDVANFADLHVSELAFATYDINRLAIIPLLFQTGYLTIKAYDDATRFYTLSYPNYEVENAFLVYLLDAFSYTEQGLSESYLRNLVDALRQNDLDLFFEGLKVLYANIDYDLHVKHEKYYQTIFYLVFKLMGLQIEAEVKTSSGRIDAVVEVADHIYLFEFKLDQDATVALEQIEQKAYYQKYKLRNKPITQVGANFSSDQRTITDWTSKEVA
ncbi:MAG: ATP-binding protein [Caldilineaceae bacterium]